MAEEGNSAADVKPKLEQEGDAPMSIKVKDQNGGEVVFKVKRSTKFKRVLDAFCGKKSWNVNQVRFVFDGQRINEDMTPDDLSMEDNDTIDAFLEQIGGSHCM